MVKVKIQDSNLKAPTLTAFLTSLTIILQKGKKFKSLRTIQSMNTQGKQFLDLNSIRDEDCLIITDGGDKLEGFQLAKEEAKYFRKIAGMNAVGDISDDLALDRPRCFSTLNHILTDFFLAPVLEHFNEEVIKLQEMPPEQLQSDYQLYPDKMSTKRPYIFKAALDNLLKRYTEDES